MVRSILAIGVVAAFTPLAALAQTGAYSEPGSYRTRQPGIQAAPTAHEIDQDYCLRLRDLYLRYLGGNELSNGTVIRRTDPEGQFAVARCEQGDPASAIPILERKLVNNRFTLPPRG